ncbi:hypothetical protein WDZ17_09990 [Pseudokineococcus basanitobsidens]|uniref:STAS domain-containing protein n=1 Tax=Pseudokineococcus basanitobsidens TaxID=1926649 RepID=A0ABU8RKP6_9ACTN
MTTAALPATAARSGPAASVTLACPHLLVMAGQVDADTVGSVPGADQLARVRVADLSAATYLHLEAVVLLLRCAQHVDRAHPGRRVRVRGATPRVRQVLQVRGAGVLLDLEAPRMQPAAP